MSIMTDGYSGTHPLIGKHVGKPVSILTLEKELIDKGYILLSGGDNVLGSWFEDRNMIGFESVFSYQRPDGKIGKFEYSTVDISDEKMKDLVSFREKILMSEIDYSNNH